MQKVREFRARARECREQASEATTVELKAHYENMAAVWDKLADERLRFFIANPEQDTDGEAEAEDAMLLPK